MSLLHSLQPFIYVFHIVLCIFMISVILLQAGKGADMGAAFGAGSSQTLFGARGAATFLSKLTTVGALFFLVTSMTLVAIQKDRSATHSNNSVLENVIQDKKPADSADTQKTDEIPADKTDKEPAPQE